MNFAQRVQEAKERKKRRDEGRINKSYFDNDPSVPCEICGVTTNMTGTKRCDPCWEAERWIGSDELLLALYHHGLRIVDIEK